MRPRPIAVIVDASVSGIHLAATPVAASAASASGGAAGSGVQGVHNARLDSDGSFLHEASSLLSPVAASSSLSLAAPIGTPFAFSSAAAAADYGDRDPLDLSVEQESY